MALLIPSPLKKIKIFSHSVRYVVYLPPLQWWYKIDLICISLKTNNNEYIFMCFCYQYIFLVICLLKSFVNFLLDCFLTLEFTYVYVYKYRYMYLFPG